MDASQTKEQPNALSAGWVKASEIYSEKSEVCRCTDVSMIVTQDHAVGRTCGSSLDMAIHVDGHVDLRYKPYMFVFTDAKINFVLSFTFGNS